MSMHNTTNSEAAYSTAAQVLRGVPNKSAEILLGTSLRRLLSILALGTLDAVALLGGLMLAAYLAVGEGRVWALLFLAPVLTAIWLAVFAAHDLYAQTQSRRNPMMMLRAMIWGIGLLAAGVIIYPHIGFFLRETLLAAFLIVL